MLTANVPNNLPIQLTSFVGREIEIAEVRRLLGGARLLTLTGAGGAGKTRLALEAARAVGDAYGDGVWLVEFAPLADPALVPQAVAAALSVQEAPGRGFTEILAEYLRTPSLLLLLDNCEHLVTACAKLADSLLHTAPELHILATSREPLDIGGEIAWRVPSLAVPGPQSGPSAEELTEYASVRLFLDRAEAALPTFALTDQNAPAVAQVCRRLDGIPLAIELAAARVKALTVEQIAERLDHRFRLLTGGGRTAIPRQQTLQACIDWSYALLTEAERALLRRLSVFAGGFALAAAEAVCNDASLEAGEILDLLSGLVDKSLVQAEPQGREERYRLLETLREYARDRLAEAGETESVRDRHRDYFLALAEEADSHLRGREQLTWIEQLIQEQDNLRAALDWSLSQESVEAALRLAGTQGCWFWYLRGQWTEGRAWLARCLDLSDRATAPSGGATSDGLRWARGRAILAAGILAMIQTDFAAALPHLEAAIPLARAADDYWGAARSLIALGVVQAFHAQHDEAAAHLQTGVALFREAGDKWGTAFALGVLGFGAYYRGDLVAARVLAEESQALVLEIGDRWVPGLNLFYLSAIAELQGELALAERHIRATLADLEALKAGGLVNVEAHIRLATVLARRGQPAESVEPLKRGLLLVREFGTATGTVTGIIAAAVVALAMSDQPPAATWAAHLVGAAAALSPATGYVPRPVERADLERVEAAARAALGAEAFAAAREAGKALTFDQALEQALQVTTLESTRGTDPSPPAPPPGPYPAGLTEREVAVLRLVARGLTSAQVAEQLVISPVTVSTHLRNMYAKLGVGSRAAAVRFAVEHGLA
jgi:non-specific serine/threonine protein kinase